MALFLSLLVNAVSSRSVRSEEIQSPELSLIDLEDLDLDLNVEELDLINRQKQHSKRNSVSNKHLQDIIENLLLDLSEAEQDNLHLKEKIVLLEGEMAEENSLIRKGRHAGFSADQKRTTVMTGSERWMQMTRKRRARANYRQLLQRQLGRGRSNRVRM